MDAYGRAARRAALDVCAGRGRPLQRGPTRKRGIIAAQQLLLGAVAGCGGGLGDSVDWTPNYSLTIVNGSTGRVWVDSGVMSGDVLTLD